LAPREGTVRLRGEVITGAPAHVVCRKGVALVPEGRKLFAKHTVHENLMLGAFAVRDKARVQKTLQWVLELFPILAERRDQVSGTMSGGEQQMVSIARGLMSSPDLLMLDEPSLGVMPSIVTRIFDVLGEIRARGTPILLVEQNVERSLRIADHAYVLQTGRIALQGKALDLLEEDLVRKAYLGL
ncbi:MAG: ABC transporter ATP-binding protein, partial [Burkholderiales bacterium]